MCATPITTSVGIHVSIVNKYLHINIIDLISDSHSGRITDKQKISSILFLLIHLGSQLLLFNSNSRWSASALSRSVLQYHYTERQFSTCSIANDCHPLAYGVVVVVFMYMSVHSTVLYCTIGTCDGKELARRNVLCNKIGSMWRKYNNNWRQLELTRFASNHKTDFGRGIRIMRHSDFPKNFKIHKTAKKKRETIGINLQNLTTVVDKPDSS